MATIFKGSDADLFFLTGILRDGGAVAVPTETVYGLAANALDSEACRRIFEIKGRPAYDPFIVHVGSRQAAGDIAGFNAAAELLADRFWPGPLTFVLPKHPIVPDIVTSGRGTVAVRMPAHPLLQRLLEIAAMPLAAPSANPFGHVSPTSAAHVEAGLGERIGHILDGGPCRVGVESTIVDVRDERDPVILRPGGISREELEAALGRPFRVHQKISATRGESAGGEIAPGLLDKHYSPRTPVTLRAGPFEAEDLATPKPSVARVCFQRPKNAKAGSAVPCRPLRDGAQGTARPTESPESSERRSHVFWLTETGDTREAARRLFALLRELDVGGFSEIEFEPAPPTGLGLAINDRLRRAAAR